MKLCNLQKVCIAARRDANDVYIFYICKLTIKRSMLCGNFSDVPELQKLSDSSTMFGGEDNGW